MKILLYSPNRDLRSNLLTLLLSEGHRVEATGVLDDAVYFLADDMVGVAVVDVGPCMRLPREIARVDPRAPVLALCSHRVNVAPCLDSGAEDALAHPFEKAELLARVRALSRRTLGMTHPIIEAGRLSFDPKGRQAFVDGRAVHMTRTEQAFFEALVSRPGQVLSVQALLSSAYAPHAEPDPKIVAVLVCKIRRKIAEVTGGDEIIRTVWGQGYRVDKEARVAA